MSRQTELSFEEIVEKFETGNVGMPCAACGGACLLVNELGELAREGDEKAEAKLIELLKHDDPGIRYPAAGYLGLIESEKALKPLEELVKKEENEMVKETAEKSIAQIRARIAEKN